MCQLTANSSDKKIIGSRVIKKGFLDEVNFNWDFFNHDL